MVKKKHPLGHQQIKTETEKPSYSELQADKDEEPKNMLVRCKVIQTLGGQFGSFSQVTMCSYQMIFQSSSLKNPQSC